MTEKTNPPVSDDPNKVPSTDVGTLRIKRGHLYTTLLPLAFVTGLALGFLIWGRQIPSQVVTARVQDSTPEEQDPAPRATQTEETATGTFPRLEISVDDDPALGPEDAPITIVEFSDFACGYCRRFHVQTFQALLDAYPGQIRFVYRDLPVVGGYEAAQAAECADEQGAFWEFHDLLFTGELGFDETAYRQYAEMIDIDPDALMECLAEGRYISEVEDDAHYAMSLGANGTPTFFINGIPLIGAHPLSEFVRIIDSELEK